MEYGKKVNLKYSQVLREFRDKTGLSQERAAQALGVRRATISDWENGKSSGREFVAGVRFAVLALREGLRVEDLILSLPDPPAGAVGENPAPYEGE